MLIFPLKKQWYEKIKSGEKTIEYREVKPYWTTRIGNGMHKLASTPITKECFEMDDFENLEDLEYPFAHVWEHTIKNCEILRQKYNETKVKAYWKELIRLLPESWLQTRMIDCNFATLRNIYAWRRGHKLTEWHKFCDWIYTLPLHELITAGMENDSNK